MNIRAATFVFIIVAALAACKTTEDMVGSGPLTLHPKTKALVNKYLSNPESVVAVRTDGRYGYVYYCPGGGTCQGMNPELTIQECESKGGTCKIYAWGGFVVWKGSDGKPSRAHEPGAAPTTAAANPRNKMSVEDLCKRALRPVKGAPPEWDTSSSWVKYVDEAKRRALTDQGCAKHAGYEQPGDMIRERLIKLKQLIDDGLLTPEEATTKRKEILEGL